MKKSRKISKEIVSFQKDLKEERGKIKKLLREKKRIEERLSKVSKKGLGEKREEILKEIEETKKKIEEIEAMEEETKIEREKIEEREKEEKDWMKKREIEKERWEKELKERNLERKKWKLEDKIEEKERRIQRIQRELEEEVNLRAKIRDIDESAEEIRNNIKLIKEKIKQRRKLEKEFKRAWESYLSGDVSSALDKLEKIQKSLSEKIGEKKPIGEKEDKKKKEFFKPLEYYQKGEVKAALDSLGKLLEKVKEKPSLELEKKIEPKPKEAEAETKVEPKAKEAAEAKPKEAEAETKVEPKAVEKAPLIIIKEKEVPKEKTLEEFKKKLEEERKKLIEEEREKLRKLREELEERQKEMLKATIEGRGLGLRERKLRELQEELIKKEIETEREYQERLRTQKEKLLKRKEELAKAEKALPLIGLTEEERKRRAEIIRSLREKVEEERERIENKELAEEQEKGTVKENKLATLQSIFEQALSFYNEKEFEKAKRIFSIIKEQAEQGKKLGLFVNLNNIPVYTKAVYFSKKIDEEIKKAIEEKEEISKLKIAKERKVKKSSKKQKILGSFFSLRKIAESFRQVFFPLPIIGLDISNYSIKLLYLNKEKKLVTLRQVLKPGVLIDGKIKNAKLFSKTLASLLNEAWFPIFEPRKGWITKAVVSLPESAVYSFIFRLETSGTSLIDKVKEKLEETLPFSLDEIYWDYAVQEDSFGNVKIVCVAAERDVVDSLVYLLRANGIQPVVLDTEMFSIRRALLLQLPSKEKVGVLDIGAYVTSFNIFDKNGSIGLSTSMPYGGYSFQTKISNFLKIPIEKAGEVIIKKGFKESPTKEILKEELEKIINEIREAIRYYREVSNENIKRIILTGGGASIAGIIEIFKERFSPIKIETINPFSKIRTEKPLSLKESLLFTPGLGLALRAASKNPARGGINLLPEKLKKKEIESRSAHIKKRTLIRIIIGILIILFLIFALYFLLRQL